MSTYTLTTLRIPKELEDMLNELGNARLAMNQSDSRKETMLQNKDDIINTLVANGDRETAACAAWDEGFSQASQDFDHAHFMLHVMADKIGTWWLELEKQPVAPFVSST